ncbi:MAG: hypothetical protein GF393_08410 [Armatimonadia bacterium]|nr:hypothetical protein [Armatimonadia bacterium]
MSGTSRTALAVTVAIMAAVVVAAAPADLDALLDGVEHVKVGGVPGPIAPIGPDAFAVLTGTSDGVRMPVVAASRYGQGRVVATGHFSFLDANSLERADTSQLIVNCIRWAAHSEDPAVGVFRRDGFAEDLRDLGINAVQIDLSDLSGLDCIVLAPERAPKESMAALEQFVRKGGGLVTAFLGWGWLQLNPDKTLSADSLSNGLLAPMGIVWLDGYLRQPDEGYPTADRPPALLNASLALDAAIAHEAGDRELSEDELALAGALLSRTVGALPESEETLLPRINEVIRERGDIVPTEDEPMKAGQVLDRLALTVRVREMMAAATEDVEAHPAAAQWPGVVPDDAPRVERELIIDCNTWGWKSIGLYAAPGEVVEVTLPEAATEAGLGLRIGSCTDRLWHKAEWKRVPEISRPSTWQRP